MIYERFKRTVQKSGVWIILLITITLFFYVLFLSFLMLKGDNLVEFYFNKINCIVRVGDEKVYKGLCSSLKVEPLREHKKTKKVIVYKDKLRWMIDKIYVSDNIKITDY